MEWIYEIYVRDLEVAYDDESPFDPNWTESYWTDREQAIEEAKRLYKKHNEWHIIVYARRVNARSLECGLWNGENYKMVFSIQKDEVVTYDDDGNFVDVK